MKKLGLFVLFICFGLSLSAQKFAAIDKSPLDVAILRADRNSKPILKIFYSRPQLNGRELSTLVPTGQVWRLGANEATELVLNQPITIGGSKLAAGNYTMYAVPAADAWTIVISKDTDVWGAYSYKEANDVVRVKAYTMAANESIEAFSIDCNYADKAIYMGWGKTIAKLPISL